MLSAWQKIQAALPAARAKTVVPNEALAAMARSSSSQPVRVQVGGLADALREADVAISKTGTITMECAFFGVPTVAMYIASGVTYQIGKRIVKVKSLTMPNLLAKEEVFPEFVQDTATPDNISHAALQLLQNQSRREKVRAKLVEVIASLGGRGASRRAAEAILSLMR
jgi:lipid-A-disaccharide synthase